ncbi:SDR family oxidoreductase [Ensifer sp. ENS06]|uniref:SDR family NAD(P)-dependent oxidoreductase n=1 Tax=Ensifer sp. ENS06 TaxID=2769276 RepID=UPI0013AFE206|nr:SDR family oxidoreductase [Ensifer sp. ENS06]MBD9624699.1 SDR family oxidoreductase [Ensifer sp. ENS06]
MPSTHPPSEGNTATASKSKLPPILVGRRAVITGAGRGMGKAIADAFEEAGATVVRLDLKEGDNVRACDVSDAASVARAFEAVASEGPITDVVHAAAIAIVSSVADMTEADFRRVTDVNLTGTFLVAREATRYLGHGGNILFIASQGGLKSWGNWGAYCASKAGVLRLADSLVEELAPHGIRVNSISPGSVETEMLATTIVDIARKTGSDPDTVRARYLSAIPMGRFCQPAEIASVAVTICSDLFSYVNGSNIVIDGGELSR